MSSLGADPIPSAPVPELPVFMTAGPEILFGILTHPRTQPLGLTTVLMRGGARHDGWGRNRMYVRMAEEIAAYGYEALRFDYHGTGESSGSATTFRTDRPFQEDVDGAIGWLRQAGRRRFALVGSCFGARTALSYAVGDPSVEALALLTCPVRDLISDEGRATPAVLERSIRQHFQHGVRPRHVLGLLHRDRRRVYLRVLAARWRAILGSRGSRTGSEADPTSWVSSSFLAPLGIVASRGVSILILYGETDAEYQDFLRASSGFLGDILEQAGARVTVRTVPGGLHGFARIEAQDRTIDEVARWLGQLRPELKQLSGTPEAAGGSQRPTS